MAAGGEGVASRSRCRVALRAGGGGGAWRTHEFAVWSGEQLVCRAAALRMCDSLLLWVGGARAQLGEAALAVAGGASCTALLGGSGEGAGAGAALARRLAAALHKPVFVFCGATFDRLALPLVERGLVAEIKSRPECF